MSRRYFVLPMLGILLSAALVLFAAEGKGGRNKNSPNQPTQNSVCNDVPAHPVDIILARPTRDSITLSVLCYQDAQGQIAYGTVRGKLDRQTPPQSFKKGEPVEVVISALVPNTQYFYQFRSPGITSPESSFRTARPAGSTFTFTIIADSHLDDRVSPAVYQRTLANALADAPDFHLDLGDTFMTEKHDNRENAARQYLAQRYYFGQLCQSAPLFFVLGNHDGESPRGRGDETDALAVWSNLMRKKYFPNPIPDAFYTGNSVKHPEAGLLQDYYAFEWGDAQFIVLDPFWFTQKTRGKGDNWKHTLGDAQYQWLKRTLEASKSKWKFVFIHHLVGGADAQCRGGSEAAPFYEWGGKNADGSNGFKEHRPTWPIPIHDLLVQHHAAIVFHGHDHLYAKQDLSGIVYQEVPQPGNADQRTKFPRHAEEYGYKAGTILGGSGHMRLTVSPAKVTAEYIGVETTADGKPGQNNRRVMDTYELTAR